MSSIQRKLKRQMQENKGTLVHKKVVAKKLGCSVSEYNRRMKQKERSLKEMEEK